MFPEVKKNFGFGCMRLPTVGEQVDAEAFKQMVDLFMAEGFNYFDTAHVYHNGLSETALRECLVERYPRESFVLTNKLSGGKFQKEEDIRPLFELQLKQCGVEYFDFYLMHAQTQKSFEKYKACRAYETALELKKEGKIRHVGFSFHDTADVLDQILTEYPQMEVVQLQFNYVDYEDASVQSRLCYEVCRKHNKPVIVMEPVKGGKLVQLPKTAQAVLDELQGGSAASYAIRFAAGFEGIMMVLSGMGNLDMVRDNCGYMKDFKPLNQMEQEAIEKVCKILKSQDQISCTACRYCLEVCPKGVPIPDLFACFNAKRLWDTWNADFYAEVVAERGIKASDCIECGACEQACPQKLPIRQHLKEVSKEFEQ